MKYLLLALLVSTFSACGNVQSTLPAQYPHTIVLDSRYQSLVVQNDLMVQLGINVTDIRIELYWYGEKIYRYDTLEVMATDAAINEYVERGSYAKVDTVVGQTVQ